MEASDGTNNTNTKLPIEVILLIVENLVAPETADPRPILPAWHLTTKTLLALTTVSKATNPLASKLLFQNCLHIDSREKAHKFRQYLSQKSPFTGRTPCEAYGPARLFLRPFTSRSGYISLGWWLRHPYRPPAFSPDPTYSLPYEDFDTVAGPTFGDDLEPQSPAQEMPSSDYSPSSASSESSTLLDLPTAEAVNDILTNLAPNLKGIVVDMPLRSLYPDEDHQGVRKILRQGFEALINVEEVTSVRDELFLATEERSRDIEWIREPEVWAQWPRLRRLALYNVLTNDELWEDMMSCPQLEMGVFTRADFVYDGDDGLPGIKRQWCTSWNEVKNKRDMTSNNELPYQGPEITMAFCDSSSALLRDFSDDVLECYEGDPDNRVCLMTVPTDSGHREFKGDEQIWGSQDWIKYRALSGTLWEDVKTSQEKPSLIIQRLNDFARP